VRELGRGGFATTWLCEGPDATLVAVKELRLGQPDGDDRHHHQNPAWKRVELFEREAKVMTMLRHPSVPRVLEYFEHTRDGGGLGLYLVQQHVEAPSLRDPYAEIQDIQRLGFSADGRRLFEGGGSGRVYVWAV
jgi:serine/threonine protein kinase